MNIFISANNTGCGKTYTTLRLIEKLSSLGYSVGVFKPVETGVEDYPYDGKKLFEKAKKHNPMLKKLSLNDIVPVQLKLPAAPYVAGKVDFERIKNAYNKIKPLCDILLIEGAGGVLVPVNETFKMVDFAKFFDAKLLLVIRSNLGCINDFLLNRYYLQNEGIEYEWAVNLMDESYFKITHPFLKKFKPLFVQKDLDKITKKLIGE